MVVLAQLGRRLERLLVAAGPLSIFCLLFAILSYGSSTSVNNTTEKQLKLAAELVLLNAKALESSYQNSLKGDASIKKIARDLYVLKLSEQFFGASVIERTSDLGGWSEFYDYIKPKLESLADQQPSEVAAALLDEARSAKKKELFPGYGVEMPEKATFTVFGTEVKLTLSTLNSLIQFAVAPLLLLWLGSIYVTRIREVLLIKDATSVAQLFPHVLNLYPLGKIPPLRKRNRIQYYFRYFVYMYYACCRLFVLLIFLAPTSGAYMVGTFFLHRDSAPDFTLVLPAAVAVYTIGVLLVEILPQHFTKNFSVIT